MGNNKSRKWFPINQSMPAHLLGSTGRQQDFARHSGPEAMSPTVLECIPFYSASYIAYGSRCNGMVRARVYIPMWAKKSAQGVEKLSFDMGHNSIAEIQYVKTGQVTLILICKMRPKCGSHEIPITHISRISQVRIKVFGNPEICSQMAERHVSRKIDFDRLTLKFGKTP